MAQLDIEHLDDSTFIPYNDAIYPEASEPIKAEILRDSFKYLQEQLEASNNAVNLILDNDFEGNEHGDLSGLSGDDHTQYLLVDGTRAMSGSLLLTDAATALGVNSGGNMTFTDAITGTVTLASLTASGATDHGALTGLTHDDHPQYLLTDGTRPVSGDFTINGDTDIFGNVLVEGDSDIGEWHTTLWNTRSTSPSLGTIIRNGYIAGDIVLRAALADGTALLDITGDGSLTLPLGDLTLSTGNVIVSSGAWVGNNAIDSFVFTSASSYITTVADFFGVGYTTPAHRLTIGSQNQVQYIGISHDNTDAKLFWSQGEFNFVSNGSPGAVNIKGDGAGYAFLRVMDQDNAEYSELACVSGVGFLTVKGSSPGTLHMQEVGGSYSEFEQGGTLRFVGDATVWNDIQFQISSGKVGAANKPSWVSLTTNTSEYTFGVNDFIDLASNELVHSWKEGTAGDFHMHIAIPDANATGSSRYAQFTLYIAYVNSSSIWTETSLTAELEIPDGSSALENFYLDMGDVAFSGLAIGTQVKVNITRIAATGGTEYGSETYIHQIGCHLECDTTGSRTEAAK